MSVDLIITNGGPHPPDVWASVTANAIANMIQIDAQSDSASASEARMAKPVFSLAVMQALYPVFQNVAADEAANVANGTTKTRSDPFSVNSAYLTQALAAITNAALNTPFQAFFADHNTQSVCISIIQQNVLDSANITRSWSFDAKGQ